MNAYDVVTARIIETLESGTIPWRKPWTASHSGSASMPTNYATRKAYRGINIVTLFCSQYPSNFWLTYKQAQDMGAQVRKGEKGSPIVFWKFDKRTDEITGEEREIGFCRTYTVFNVAQCDGIPAEQPAPVSDFEEIDAAETIAAQYFGRPAAPTLANGGNAAYYMPLRDHIQMPAREAFIAPANYYAALFHEMAHSTGAKGRLDRELVGVAQFGGESYSREELIAEFCSAFLCAEAGISTVGLLENSAAYIRNWLHALRNDKTLAISAAQRAQRAADYVMARSFAE